VFEKPHKQNKEVTKINANPVLETLIVATFSESDVFIWQCVMMEWNYFITNLFSGLPF
jgi:hypothetical protein